MPAHVFQGLNKGLGSLYSLIQARSGEASDTSGFTIYGDNTNGQMDILHNCYMATAANVQPLEVDKACWRITLGGTNHGIRFYAAAPNGSTSEIPIANFTLMGGLLIGGTQAYKTEASWLVPLRGSDPTYTDGANWWEGSMYYNTATNKLRLNTGAMTWIDLN